ncbi:MAG TPA: hypothetical protein VGA98_04580 [Allosphingosinicella sp.]|jgi:hypothetical protein
MKIRSNLRAGLVRDRCGGTYDRCGGSTRCGGTRCGGTVYAY